MKNIIKDFLKKVQKKFLNRVQAPKEIYGNEAQLSPAFCALICMARFDCGACQRRYARYAARAALTHPNSEKRRSPERLFFIPVFVLSLFVKPSFAGQTFPTPALPAYAFA